jgi:hypothetical protein
MPRQFKIALICGAAVAAMVAGPEAKAETLLECGTHLMRSIVACGNCHTPKGPRGDIPSMELAGMAPMTKNLDFTANARNTTPDKETGIGAWTDTQIVIAIHEGQRPERQNHRAAHADRSLPRSLGSGCQCHRGAFTHGQADQECDPAIGL